MVPIPFLVSLLIFFTFEKNSTLLEKVSRIFWTPMFQLVLSQHFQTSFHLSSFPIVPRQLRCFKYFSNKIFFKWQLLHILCTTLIHHIVSPPSSNSWSCRWSFDTFKSLPNWPLIWRETYISSYLSHPSILFHHHSWPHELMNWCHHIHHCYCIIISITILLNLRLFTTWRNLFSLHNTSGVVCLA